MFFLFVKIDILHVLHKKYSHQCDDDNNNSNRDHLLARTVGHHHSLCLCAARLGLAIVDIVDINTRTTHRRRTHAKRRAKATVCRSRRTPLSEQQSARVRTLKAKQHVAIGTNALFAIRLRARADGQSVTVAARRAANVRGQTAIRSRVTLQLRIGTHAVSAHDRRRGRRRWGHSRAARRRARRRRVEAETGTGVEATLAAGSCRCAARGIGDQVARERIGVTDQERARRAQARFLLHADHCRACADRHAFTRR